ncbi:hypothetical protein [Paenibacillus xylaniclasticus]|uniref:hypothetical protein n=1 Tax=Paenibacillus xylaniclasticus TaxID=588083 RepID=UPI000FDA4072|nr:MULTISPECIES: hypothetical protein [Paenibacillus]GFN31591.1 hypothetical protein PCURB6_18510 [Paenibacillus curdlanolyticus]
MNNGIPQKYQGVVRDLLQKLKGTGKRIELITEKGAYTMQATKSSDSFVIETVDDNEVIEVDDNASTVELRVTVQDAVREKR